MPRLALLALSAFVTVTATAGGVALIIGAIVPDAATVLSPPDGYLVGSPFRNYLVPGLTLLLVVGGLQFTAFMLQMRRSAWRHILTAVAWVS